jgi:glycerophosphoryl diester phosphodiesterase
MKMKIIGHRGAAGLELENTLASIKRALQIGVDAVEIDVRLTKDSRLVLAHDEHLSRISESHDKIRDLTLAELNQIPLHNGECTPLLSEVLVELKNSAVIIELKDEGSIPPLLADLDNAKDVDITVTSFHRGELAELRKVRPVIKIYVAALTSPFEIIQNAALIDAQGINLNFWLLNPLTYWQAQRAKLDIMVFTIDNRFLVRFLHLLYPKVRICTNYPHRFCRPRKAAAKSKSPVS